MSKPITYRKATERPQWMIPGEEYGISARINRETHEVLIGVDPYGSKVKRSQIPIYSFMQDERELRETDLSRQRFSNAHFYSDPWEWVDNEAVRSELWATLVGYLTDRFSARSPLNEHHREVAEFLRFCNGCDYADKTGVESKCFGSACCSDHMRQLCAILWSARKSRMGGSGLVAPYKLAEDCFS